jgi:hypothetical protein
LLGFAVRGEFCAGHFGVNSSPPLGEYFISAASSALAEAAISTAPLKRMSWGNLVAVKLLIGVVPFSKCRWRDLSGDWTREFT